MKMFVGFLIGFVILCYQAFESLTKVRKFANVIFAISDLWLERPPAQKPGTIHRLEGRLSQDMPSSIRADMSSLLCYTNH